jgi:hypothetical protein
VVPCDPLLYLVSHGRHSGKSTWAVATETEEESARASIRAKTAFLIMAVVFSFRSFNELQTQSQRNRSRGENGENGKSFSEIRTAMSEAGA